MLTYQNTFTPKAKSIWGSRILRCGSIIERSSIRHYLSRIFATVISYYLGVKTYDSQCGAKLFKTELAKDIFNREFITNWIFDVEIYLRINNHHSIVEYPLSEWKDIAGSKVNVLKEVPRVIKDIKKLKNIIKNE